MPHIPLVCRVFQSVVCCYVLSGVDVSPPLVMVGLAQRKECLGNPELEHMGNLVYLKVRACLTNTAFVCLEGKICITDKLSSMSLLHQCGTNFQFQG